MQFFSIGNFPCLQPVLQRLIKYSEPMKGYRVLRDTADEIIRQRRIEASGKVFMHVVQSNSACTRGQWPMEADLHKR